MSAGSLSARDRQWSGFAAAAALLPPALLPPLIFVASPSLRVLVWARAAEAVLLLLLLLLPALAGLAAARAGFQRLADPVPAGRYGDLVFAVSRIFAALVLFGYAAVLVWANGAAMIPCLAVAALALVAGWLWLLLTVLRIGAGPALRLVAIAADGALLSGFLHVGGAAAAGAFPLCAALIFYAGWQFGLGALAVAAGISIVGAAALTAAAGLWRDLPAVAAASVALLGVFTLATAAALRTIADAKRTAAAAAAARRSTLQAAEDSLRQALAAADDTDGSAVTDELRGRMHEAGDLLSLAAGRFVAQRVAFDLHGLVNDLAPALRRDAARQSARLAIRVDPATPYRLIGAQRQLARILCNLVALGLEPPGTGALRLALAIGTYGLRLRLVLCRCAPLRADGPAFRVTQQLLAAIGGRIECHAAAPETWRVGVELPIALDPEPPPPLDLADRPVLLVSEDGRFAEEFAEPLNGWRADVRWLGGCDNAFAHLERSEYPVRPVLIVDARLDSMPALALAYRAAQLGTAAPHAVVVSAPRDAERIAALVDPALATVLAAPDALALLESALHALPLDGAAPAQPAAPQDEPAPAAAAGLRPVAAEGQVTPITAHPRFFADPPATLDLDAIASLRTLSGGDAFLSELVEAFRDETRCLLERIGGIIEPADLVAFAAAVAALQRCAGNVGGARLGELAASLRRASVEELRANGAEYVNRLSAEIARLDAALADLLAGPQSCRQ